MPVVYTHTNADDDPFCSTNEDFGPIDYKGWVGGSFRSSARH
jgi:hypothetical protein